MIMIMIMIMAHCVTQLPSNYKLQGVDSSKFSFKSSPAIIFIEKLKIVRLWPNYVR